MPTYEYSCPHCETVFELWQNVGEGAPPCPQCAATDVKKVFHPPRVHFKGSGFYLTDLRAEQAKAGSGASKSAETADSAPAETKTETAAPAKSDTTAAKSESSTATATPAASK